jgi:hypothetical protein
MPAATPAASPTRTFAIATSNRRFRLVVEAVARGNEQEADRLAAACPRKVYRMIDAGYGDRMRASSEIVSAVCLDLGPRLGKLRMVEASREFLPLFLGRGMDVAAMAWLDGYAEGKSGGRKRDDEIVEAGIEKAIDDAKLAINRVLEVLEKLRDDVAAEIKGIWEGFNRFSKRELRLEPDTLVSAWFAPALTHLHAVCDALDGVQPAAALLDQYEATLTKMWRQRIGQDEEPP